MNVKELEIVDTYRIGSTTLVGYSKPKKDEPYTSGNCFDLVTNDNKHFRIVNFYHENIVRVMKLLKIDFPIKVKILEGNKGIIHDSRIPHKWYNNRFCSVCTPKHLLPIPQQLERQRDIESGTLVIGDGFETRKFTGDIKSLGYKFTTVASEVIISSDINTGEINE